MSHIPKELRYSRSHEWVHYEDGIATVGITDHAQALLGDVVFVELPDIDLEVTVGDEAGVVESVKAASDIYTPLSGRILEVNSALTDSPSLLNQDPYNDAWIFKLKIDDFAELDDLLDAVAYEALVNDGEH